MQFRDPAPGNLVQEGTTFYADWSIASGNFGFSDAAVEAQISSVLNDPRGIEATGIQTRHVSGIGNVIFHVVETIAGPSTTLGLTYWNTPPPIIIEIEAAVFDNPDVITHEALHGFCYAIHSPEGTDSIMEPIEDPGEEWLSATDIAQVEAWLSGAPVDTTFWYPGDLDSYITHWIVPASSKTRLVATIIQGAPVVIRAVYSTDYTGMLAGTYQHFGRGMDAGTAGIWATEWVDAPAGEYYVGIIVEGATSAEFQDLIIGLAEVEIAGASATGGGSPVPN